MIATEVLEARLLTGVEWTLEFCWAGVLCLSCIAMVFHVRLGSGKQDTFSVDWSQMATLSGGPQCLLFVATHGMRISYKAKSEKLSDNSANVFSLQHQNAR
jgi:hypothetical protein